MRLDPTFTPAEIAEHLRAQAERIYGPERAKELSEQVGHLANMMSEVASRELDLNGPPPDATGFPDRRGS